MIKTNTPNKVNFKYLLFRFFAKKIEENKSFYAHKFYSVNFYFFKKFH